MHYCKNSILFLLQWKVINQVNYASVHTKINKHAQIESLHYHNIFEWFNK